MGRKKETIIKQQTKVTLVYESENNFKAMEINVLVKQNTYGTLFFGTRLWIDRKSFAMNLKNCEHKQKSIRKC